MNQIYETINNCRVCNSIDIKEVLDLGNQPPANSLHKDNSDKPPLVPLRLLFCKDCCAVQLGETVDPEYLFNEYVWVTGTSSTAELYSRDFTKNALEVSGLKEPSVIEIASNDGTFLKCFQESGCEVLGIDPAKNIAEEASSRGIPTLSEFFSSELASDLVKNKGKADIVFARNVIPHVKAIHSIIEGINILMDDESTGIIEFHEAGLILKELHYDSIYHEHLFYFSLKTISFLLEKYDLFVFDVMPSPISGGSWVIYFSKTKRTKSKELNQAELSEEELGINDLETWLQFSKNVKDHAIKIKSLLPERRIMAYGASARSSTLLNYCGIGASNLVAIIDKNPLKHNLLSPGVEIPIISYEEGLEILKKEKDIFLLAWNFEEEIIKDLRKDGFTGNFIVPLPNDPRKV
tara:strand:- start:1359 stop:2579 length:1221 start_codon:yes stop_codon:yes gene_type:complete